MVDGKQLGTVGFQKLGTPYSEMDCQAFVEWCLRQCGLNKDLAGSNAWFREVFKNGVIMTPEECVKELGTVPAGAFLFILEHDGGEPAKYKPDGLGNASHIGLVTGKGEGAIHSSASRGCVAESKFKNKTINGGWNRVGLWNKVAYDYSGEGSADPDPEPTPEPTPEPAGGSHAMVWSENDLPVNTRTGPGKNYGQSKAGKLPVGTDVEILKRTTNSNGEEWCQIRCTENGATWTCWMMAKFLKVTDDNEYVPPADKEPADDFTPGDMESDGDVALTIQMSQEEAATLLAVVDRMSWQLVQILGGRG